MWQSSSKVHAYSLKCTERYCQFFLKSKSRRLVYRSVAMVKIKFRLVYREILEKNGATCCIKGFGRLIR